MKFTYQILNIGFWKRVVGGFNEKIHMDIEMLIEGLFGSATILMYVLSLSDYLHLQAHLALLSEK
jgi:hypothetical protein